MNLIETVIENLKNDRKIFHSEDDLKLSLSLVINKLFPDYKIRLERPIDIKMIDNNGKESIVRAPIDIVIIDNKENIIPIELKYKTKGSELSIDNELYSLANQGATDTGRFSFRKDIYRIEQFLKKHNNCDEGYVLIITNEPAYIENNVSNRDNMDKNFSFHQNAIIDKNDSGWNYEKLNQSKYHQTANDLKWKAKTGEKLHWTCSKDYFYQLDLMNNYKINWKTYSIVNDEEFKFCLIKIEK